MRPLSKTCSPGGIPVFMSTWAQRFGPMMKNVLKIWPGISSGRVSLSNEWSTSLKKTHRTGLPKLFTPPKTARAGRHSMPWIGWPNWWCIYREDMNTPSAITATTPTSRRGCAKRPGPMIESPRLCSMDCHPRNSGAIGPV